MEPNVANMVSLFKNYLPIRVGWQDWKRRSTMPSWPIQRYYPWQYWAKRTNFGHGSTLSSPESIAAFLPVQSSRKDLGFNWAGRRCSDYLQELKRITSSGFPEVGLFSCNKSQKANAFAQSVFATVRSCFLFGWTSTIFLEFVNVWYIPSCSLFLWRVRVRVH